MRTFVFTKPMAIGVKSFICTYFLHEPSNCEKSQINIFLGENRDYLAYLVEPQDVFAF